MQEARLYTKADNESVICNLCMHRCHIRLGKLGLCGVRKNIDGRLQSLVYGRIIAEHVDPIEKKPLFHLLPGSTSYSIATVGCNMRCLHCQNHEISQYPHLHNGNITGRNLTPEEIVEAACAAGCKSISYTYVEPTVFFEYACDTAFLAHSRGIKNVFVSNGYMTARATEELAPLLDGINIDLKAFTDSFYKKICKASLQPVLDTIALMHEQGVWVEVTTLIIPGLNDSSRELHDIASFICSISPSIPWHVTAFYPTWQMRDRPPTPRATLAKARETGLAAGLKFVYQGNQPGGGGENTHCFLCGSPLILRHGYHISEKNLVKGCCNKCGTLIPGVWE
jgi:pyruvate formate lyase activating enzyme